MAIPKFEEIPTPTDAQAEQFMAEQQFYRDVEWLTKHGLSRLDLFAR